MSLLSVENLNKIYGEGQNKVHALRDVSFALEQGDFAAIIGESGSGKSTLLNVVGALDQPDSGNIVMAGKELFTMSEKELTVFRRRSIGFIFQAFNLIPELTVEQNIQFPLLLDYQKPDKSYVDEILNALSLEDRRGHLPSQLSGGQQQRVAIARALATKPALILADEPTGNLDSRNSQEVISLLKDASKKYNQTVMMITHNNNYSGVADRLFQMQDGCLCELEVRPA